MIGIQVAINYGLFCKEIIFHGVFDTIDKTFIRNMMENTAREIYVKKILEENSFLIEGFEPESVERKRSYTNAQLLFQSGRIRNKLPGWESSKNRCAVLLSGGKESLLSYGLLRDIGLETYPVFVNESGRHWFTALNSYRSFAEREPRTSRVWTNSDRLFAWKLRYLPFIRHDFAKIRSDEYPLRLWTVAVFLFGALPLLRKKGIGRLIIGDEYDTTRRERFQGIPHFDGLYDQSRYFDTAVTSYFRKKGWDIEQFSVVRPLSELLVEKILLERYPDLQKNQTSCHMTHIDKDRARPCGRCEKCHRIVGMLCALGANPAVCGYMETQTKACLKNLPKRNIHQEPATSQHMFFLLKQKGLIDGPEKVEPHPEVENLRFDHECSPVDSVPEDMRASLIKILLKHAKGALRKSGPQWVPFDPLEETGSR
jgi:hypothetical protein